MKKETKINFIVLFLTVAFLVLFVFLFTDSFFGSAQDETDSQNGVPTSALVREDKIDVTNPKRLIIPSISLNANIEHTGLNKSGNMVTPSDFRDVAWYKFGARPGEPGNAVMAGHLDNRLGLPAVFQDLRDIKMGDNIFVQDEQRKIMRFEVVDVRSYGYKEEARAAQEIFGSSTQTRINLITCQGNWVKSDKTYNKRLVIVAELKN